MGIFAEVEKVIRSQRFKKTFFDMLGTSRWISDSSDIDEVVQSGWYTYGEDNISQHKPFAVGEIFVIGSRLGTSCIQIATNRSAATTSDPQIKIRRYTAASSWSGWEWLNPPMVSGDKYRTVKRWENSPVWATKINFGSLPNTSTKSVSLDGFTATNIVSIKGYLVTASGNHYPIPYTNTNGEVVVWYRTNQNGLQIQTKTDMSGSNAYFVIEYIL